MISEVEKSDSEIELIKIGEKESFEFNLPSIEFNELFFEVRFKDFSKDTSKVFIFWKDEEPIAYIALILSEVDNSALVSSLFVLEKHRRNGYAKELIKKALNLKSVEKITLHAFSHNDAAFNLYKKLGFNIVSYKMEYKNAS